MTQIDAADLNISDLNKIRAKLVAEKQRIIAEITEYPPPIPACDQQFNFLLEERTRVTKLLRKVDAMRAGGAVDAEFVASLEEAR